MSARQRGGRAGCTAQPAQLKERSEYSCPSQTGGEQAAEGDSWELHCPADSALASRQDGHSPDNFILESTDVLRVQLWRNPGGRMSFLGI